MFRDLKEYQQLQKLYEAVSNTEIKKEKNKKLIANNDNKNNKNENDNNKNDNKVTGTGSVVDNPKTKDQDKNTAPKGSFGISPEGAKQAADNRAEFKAKQAAADKKEVEFRLKNTESSEQSAKAETAPEKRKLTGKERAQQMAKDRIKSGKSIADVNKDNTKDMKARAEKRFADFKAKREAKRLARMKKEEFSSYDMVLEYLLSTEQVATIEEANYVMTEMDAETIQGIVEEQEKNLNEIVGAAVKGLKAVGKFGAKGMPQFAATLVGTGVVGQTVVKPIAKTLGKMTAPKVQTPNVSIEKEAQPGDGIPGRRSDESLADYYKRRNKSTQQQIKNIP